jgi:hypothetical protein
MPSGKYSLKAAASPLSDEPDPGFVTLASIDEQPIAILLGDPGSGKSREMLHERLRVIGAEGAERVIELNGREIGTDFSLSQRWFQSQKWKNWLTGSEVLWVFFDGFDESKKLLANLDDLVLGELTNAFKEDPARLERLRLRFASRTTGWSLSHNLKKLCQDLEKEVGTDQEFLDIYYLAPPSWLEIQTAAESSGVDFDVFRQRVVGQGIAPFALRPAQLQWLLQYFSMNEELPINRQSLYWEGVRQLCIAQNNTVAAEDLALVAGRIAFIGVFTGKQDIWSEEKQGVTPPNCTLLSDLIGGAEVSPRDPINVDISTLRKVLETGLFFRAESGQISWAHQTYPDFLAAKYLHGLGIPLSQRLGLITNPMDASSKVIPGLEDVASWLALIDDEVRDYLISHDPATLMYNDIVPDDSSDRSELISAYLEGMQSGLVVRTKWNHLTNGESMNFEGIETVLASFISEQQYFDETRTEAIRIAEDYDLTGLGNVLVELVLDNEDSDNVRIDAAWGVVRIGTSENRSKILPLIRNAEDYLSEELLGCALKANWPANLVIEDTLPIIGMPVSHTFGAYKSFLYNDFIQKMPNEYLQLALTWAFRQSDWGDDDFEFRSISRKLIERVMSCENRAELMAGVARIAGRNLVEYKPPFGDMSGELESSFLSSETLRRGLLEQLAALDVDAKALSTIAFSIAGHLQRHPEWLDADYSWIAKNLRETTDGSNQEKFWARLLRGLKFVDLVFQADILFELRDEDRLWAYFKVFFDAQSICSEHANSYREDDEKRRNRKTNSPEFFTQTEVLKMLRRVEKGAPQDWWLVDQLLWWESDGRGFEHPSTVSIKELPGWGKCDKSTRDHLLEWALPFLKVVQPDSEVLGTSSYYKADRAAYRALTLLLEDSPERLNELSKDDWNRLIPVVLGMWKSNGVDEIRFQSDLLGIAISRGAEVISSLQRMARNATDETWYFSAPALRSFGAVADTDQIELFCNDILESEVSTSVLQDVLILLARVNRQAAIKAGSSIVEQRSSKEESIRDASRIALTVLDEFVDSGAWNDLWNILEDNKQLLELTVLGIGHSRREHELLGGIISEAGLAKLYSKLVVLYPPNEDPNVIGVHTVTPRESAGMFRGSVLSALVFRGTWTAVNELRRLIQLFGPDTDGLSGQLAFAEERARRHTWNPPSVNTLMGIARDKEKRIVSSPDQLLAVILESLVRLQNELIGESPAAVDVWNLKGKPPKGDPKDEEFVSDYIKRHLDRDLACSGIISNREVENRRGDVTDIYVTCFDPVSKQNITVVIEVKGCWNSGVYTSMKNQLMDRYLVNHALTHGIYAVAYFDCERWPKGDGYRGHAAKGHTYEELSTDMSRLASELSNDVVKIKSVVLDCRF